MPSTFERLPDLSLHIPPLTGEVVEAPPTLQQPVTLSPDAESPQKATQGAKRAEWGANVLGQLQSIGSSLFSILSKPLQQISKIFDPAIQRLDKGRGTQLKAIESFKELDTKIVKLESAITALSTHLETRGYKNEESVRLKLQDAELIEKNDTTTELNSTLLENAEKQLEIAREERKEAKKIHSSETSTVLLLNAALVIADPLRRVLEGYEKKEASQESKHTKVKPGWIDLE